MTYRARYGSGPAILSGTVTVTLNNAVSGTVAVSFAVFTEAPVVVATTENGNFLPIVSNRTATGADVGCAMRDGQPANTSVIVNWIATGWS